LSNYLVATIISNVRDETRTVVAAAFQTCPLPKVPHRRSQTGKARLSISDLCPSPRSCCIDFVQAQKKLVQWIETDNPNGVEILDRLARSPSPFAPLINRAVADFRIVERRAAALFERQFAEFSERQDATAASVVQLEAKLGKLQLDNRRIHDQIAREKADEQSLRDDVARLQAQLAPAPLAREDPEIGPEDRELLDPVEFLNIERAKLEAALDLLESRLMELTQQQKELLQRPVRM
jgi:hypothetical protein